MILMDEGNCNMDNHDHNRTTPTNSCDEDNHDHDNCEDGGGNGYAFTSSILYVTYGTFTVLCSRNISSSPWVI